MDQSTILSMEPNSTMISKLNVKSDQSTFHWLLWNQWVSAFSPIFLIAMFWPFLLKFVAQADLAFLSEWKKVFIYKYLFIWMKCSRIEDFLPGSGLLVLPEGSSGRLLGFKWNITFDKSIGKLVSGCFQSGLQTSCRISGGLEFFLAGFIFLKIF